MSDEEYVRSKWKLVAHCDGSYQNYLRGTVLLQDVNRHWFDFDSWSAAVEFTREREEQIRHVEEEIALLEGWKHLVEVKNPAALRILGREQAALAELKKGMK